MLQLHLSDQHWDATYNIRYLRIIADKTNWLFTKKYGGVAKTNWYVTQIKELMNRKHEIFQYN